MLRIGISVEGATEREFVNQLMMPYFSEQGILTPPVPMNGNIRLDRIRHELPRLLGSFDSVTTFYDLYGFKRRKGKSAEELERNILERVDRKQRQRLIPYIQQYEFEALVFRDPAIIADQLCAANQSRIEAIVREAGEPEQI